MMQAIEAKARKVSKQSQEFKASLESLQELLASAAEELTARTEAAAQAAAEAPASASLPGELQTTDPDPATAALSDVASAASESRDMADSAAAAEGSLSLRDQESCAESAAGDESSPQATAALCNATIDVSALEQQMAILAVASKSPAAAAAALSPADMSSSAATQERPSMRDATSPQTRSTKQSSASAATAEPISGATAASASGRDANAGCSALGVPGAQMQQQQQLQPIADSSDSLSEALLGSDVPHAGFRDEDLPATQLQDSSSSAFQEAEV